MLQGPDTLPASAAGAVSAPSGAATAHAVPLHPVRQSASQAPASGRPQGMAATGAHHCPASTGSGNIRASIAAATPAGSHGSAAGRKRAQQTAGHRRRSSARPGLAGGAPPPPRSVMKCHGMSCFVMVRPVAASFSSPRTAPAPGKAGDPGPPAARTACGRREPGSPPDRGPGQVAEQRPGRRPGGVLLIGPPCPFRSPCRPARGRPRLRAYRGRARRRARLSHEFRTGFRKRGTRPRKPRLPEPF